MEQETAYSAVVVNDHMYILPISFSMFLYMTPFGSKTIWGRGYMEFHRDTYDRSLQLHHRQFLVPLVADLYHPYPPSFHEMIVPLIFRKPSTKKGIHYIRMRTPAE